MSTVPGSEALAGLVALLSKTMSPTTRCCVVAAITKAVLKSGPVSENVTKTAVTLHAQNNIHVKQVYHLIYITLHALNNIHVKQVYQT